MFGFAKFRRPLQLIAAGAVCLSVLLPVSVQAQKAGEDSAKWAGEHQILRSPILTVDPDRLFKESRYGKKLEEKLETLAQQISSENRRLEAQLSAEEKDLTEKRKTMDAEDFRKLASAFDEKVTRIRHEREEKAKDLGKESDEIRRQFLTSVQPVLDEIMHEAGAAVIMDRKSVFVSRDAVDITDEAIARIDATLLQGQSDASSDNSSQGDTENDGTGDAADTSQSDSGQAVTPDEDASEGGSGDTGGLSLGTDAPAGE